MHGFARSRITDRLQAGFARENHAITTEMSASAQEFQSASTPGYRDSSLASVPAQNDVPLNLVAHPYGFGLYRHIRMEKIEDVILSASHLGAKNPCIYAGGQEGPLPRPDSPKQAFSEKETITGTHGRLFGLISAPSPNSIRELACSRKSRIPGLNVEHLGTSATTTCCNGSRRRSISCPRRYRRLVD